MLKNYHEVRDWLEGFIPQTYTRGNLGLSRIDYLLKLLGNPQRKFKSVHVAGTSAKGSTAFYIARLLENIELNKNALALGHSLRRGQRSEVNLHEVRVSQNPETAPSRATSPRKKLKVGLHISPHLIYIGERMQINGKPITVKRLVRLVNEIKPIVEKIEKEKPQLTPSYFEILTALCFLYFASEKVDWAVVEVGLGGRLDATNVLTPEVSVITNIGLDHTEILGNTISKIAKEKAGIIKEKIPVVTGAGGAALKVIEKATKNKNARLIKLDTHKGEKGINPDIQVYNKAYYDIERYIKNGFAYFSQKLAILTVSVLGKTVSSQQVKRAFSDKFPGRFEVIEKGVALDGAHNEDKIKYLVNYIKNQKLLNKKIVLVVAFKKGKNWKKMLNILIKNLAIKKVIATEYMAATDTGFGSAVPAKEIAGYLTRDKRLRVLAIKNSQEAVFEAVSEKNNEDLVLVTGSLYLVGEARTIWILPTF